MFVTWYHITFDINSLNHFLLLFISPQNQQREIQRHMPSVIVINYKQTLISQLSACIILIFQSPSEVMKWSSWFPPAYLAANEEIQTVKMIVKALQPSSTDMWYMTLWFPPPGTWQNLGVSQYLCVTDGLIPTWYLRKQAMIIHDQKADEYYNWKKISYF